MIIDLFNRQEIKVELMKKDDFTINNVTPQMIKQIRKETRAGTIDCREAIIESRGDVKQAIEILKSKGKCGPKKVWI